MQTQRPPSSFIINDLPYYSQWESSELVGKIIRSEISAEDDPLWRQSGAKTPQEYEYWAKNMCGMACLKMILKHEFAKNIPIIKLGKKCAAYGGYIENEDTIDGLYYPHFVKFIADEFGLMGKIFVPLSIDGIIEEMLSGHYVIASVNQKIRNPKNRPASRGGHLILMLGFDLAHKNLFFHDPAGDQNNNQSYAKISFKRFGNFFAERGISIESNYGKYTGLVKAVRSKYKTRRS